MKKDNASFHTFYNVQYLTKNQYINPKSNSFNSELKLPEFLTFNNTMLKLKRKYFNINKLKIKPPINKKVEKINSKSTPLLLINNINKKNISPEKQQLDEKVDKIVDMLINNKINKNKYLKEKYIFNKELKEKDVDPKYIIKRNFQYEPNNKNLFKSYGIQVKALGNERYRKALFRGVNDYETQTVKYSTLKGPTGLNLSEKKQKTNSINNDIKKIIWEMEQNFYDKKTNKNRNKVNKNLPLIIKYNTFGKSNLTSRESIDEKIFKSMVNAERTLSHFKERGKEYEKIKQDIKKRLNEKKKNIFIIKNK